MDRARPRPADPAAGAPPAAPALPAAPAALASQAAPTSQAPPASQAAPASQAPLASEAPLASQAPPSPAAAALARDLLDRLLGRAARPREVALWAERLAAAPGADDFLRTLLRWRPLAQTREVRTQAPSGHPGSPVVDPALVGPYLEESRAAGRRAVAGVPLDLAAMAGFWARNAAVIAATPAGEGPYPLADAAVLRAMVHERRPRRAIEVGAPMRAPTLLAVAGAAGLELDVTASPPAGRPAAPGEPDPRIAVVAGGVQRVPLATFAALAAGDMVLVASSHVLKTGSDVHHLLFHVLPVLAPGVLVELHGCRFPFEYANAQVLEKNTSWNEAYAVRALLMHSSRFRVLFSGSLFAAEREADVAATFPPFLKNSGSTLWLEVVDDGGPSGLAAVGGFAGFSDRVAGGRAPQGPAAPGAAGPGAAAPSTPGAAAPAAGPSRAVAPGTPEAAARAEGPSRAAAAGAQPPGGAAPAALLTPLPPRRPGGPPMVRATVVAEGRTIAFDVVDGGAGPPYFALGVRKSGSTLFHKVVTALARANEVNTVDVPGTFFRHGLTVAAWARQDLAAMVRPGNVYTGFRSFPGRLAASEAYGRARKVFMHRDPRDAIVSQYFSDAFSHDLPDGAGRETFLAKREAARASDIDRWVVKHAPSLAKTLAEFEAVLSDAACLVLPYEAYVFEKRALIDAVLAHFGWRAGDEAIARLIADVDVRPQSEDPKRFVRKATPGDHKAKLAPETVAELDAIFARALAVYGYA